MNDLQTMVKESKELDGNSLFEKTMTVREVAAAVNVDERTIQREVSKFFPEIVKNGVKTVLTEEQVACISKDLKGHHNLDSTVKVPTTRLEGNSLFNTEEKWYSIEDLASLCGYDVTTLKNNTGTNNPLNCLSISIETNTRLGGYHNTKKYYSEKVLRALKDYQLKNAVPNAVKDKLTVVKGNLSVVQQDTYEKTINELLNNPVALMTLVKESSNRCIQLQHRAEIAETSVNTLIRIDEDESITKVCTRFGVQPRKYALPYLHEQGYLTTSNLPTQKAVQEGILAIKTNIDPVTGEHHEQSAVKKSMLLIWERRIIPNIKRYYELDKA